MNVGHPLEAFTTIFGWMQFQNLWDILVFSGIAFVPFLLIVVRAFVDNYTGQEAKAGTRKSVHMMEVEIVKALSVVVLAAQPIWPLALNELEFDNSCDQVPDISNIEDTTYQDSFDVSNATVPVWWYATMAISKGITGAAIAGIGCSEDMVRTRIELDLQRISDPEVAQNVQRFTNECFVRARSRFQNDRPDVESLLDQHGIDDPEFVGSRVYLQTEGFYDYYRAARPVPGFDYIAARDDPDYNEGAEPDYGRPTCEDWWNGDTGPSLRGQILEQMDATFWEGARDRMSGWFGASDEELEDRMIRRLVAESEVNAPVATGGLTNADSNAGGLSGMFSMVAASIGVGAHEMFTHGPMMFTIREAAPMVQSFLLMGIYMLLPILLVLSLYSWGPVFIATASILTITFWSYLWAVSRWLEDSMMAALHPSTSSYLVASNLGSLLSADGGTRASILNIVIGMLHIGLPVLFSMIVGWAGYKVADSVAAADKTTGPMANAGPATASAAGRFASRGKK
ncbi:MULTISPECIES: conjugal transfer protein TraG N-terminal domain-containing protein [unclassified Thioalkalivibrio]|uniref:conjugal transfer protein TraG N-terminal domain-containing protein n=1 Tax=unclassified Thioalkalivibrio TaxID=2621013 RepID=UPI0003780B3F|nr:MULTISPECIES: conjugal transfer protein TraG N-terminal domain-containing protein [unclassified Thioalkalivibrio]